MVGLGNPGRRYRDTRHNAGLMAARRLLEQSEVIAEAKWSEGCLGLVRSGPLNFLILEPRIFMNVSGRALSPVVDHYRLGPDRLVVLHDDIDIPAGDVRVKRGGGTGGHRGLESLEDTLGGGGFMRVRIGVGRPPEGVDPADYVLDEFLPEERGKAAAAVTRAAELALELAGEVAGDTG